MNFFKNNDIKNILPLIIKETNVLTKKDKNISYENLLKLAMSYLDNEMNYLDNDSSNIVV